MSFLSFLFPNNKPKFDENIPVSVYQFKVAALDGNEIDFSTFKGKKILIVNTASKCGFTKQYAELEELFESHKERLVIVGFPANNFMRQEPGDNEQIAIFCKNKYGIIFPMAAKISVKGKTWLQFTNG